VGNLCKFKIGGWTKLTPGYKKGGRACKWNKLMTQIFGKEREGVKEKPF